MQIREMDLTELYTIYNLVSQLRTELSYDEFEDLVYDMRDINYKMFGILDGEKLISYAGINIQTSFCHKRYLYIFDFITDKNYSFEKYDSMMLEFLEDYAKIGMCGKILFSSDSCLENSLILNVENRYDKSSNLYERKLIG